MAESIIYTYNFAHLDSTYSGDTGTGASILQGSVTENVGSAEKIIEVIRVGPRKILAADTAKAFFPTIADLPSGARITVEIQVDYGSADLTAADRIITWTVDTETIKTHEKRASFGFNASFVMASRTGTDPLFITCIYYVRA